MPPDLVVEVSGLRPKTRRTHAASRSQMYIVGRDGNYPDLAAELPCDSWHSMDSVWLGTICGRARIFLCIPTADRDVGRAPYPSSQS